MSEYELEASSSYSKHEIETRNSPSIERRSLMIITKQDSSRRTSIRSVGNELD